MYIIRSELARNRLINEVRRPYLVFYRSIVWIYFSFKKEERLISYEPFEFGQEATLNALRETSEEDIVKNIRNEYKNQYADIHGGQQVADLEYTEESINEKINKHLDISNLIPENSIKLL